MMRAHANILNNTEAREENNCPLASQHPEMMCLKLFSVHTVLLACQLDMSTRPRGEENLSGERAPVTVAVGKSLEAFS